MSRHTHGTDPSAELLLANARSFLPARDHAPDRTSPDEWLHMIAISIELALKAVLLAAGGDDRSNRVYIGHNLARAADKASDHGFVVRTRVQALISVIHPHFMNGGFQRSRRENWPKVTRYARIIAAGLIDDVDRAFVKDTIHPGHPSPREERADDGR